MSLDKETLKKLSNIFSSGINLEGRTFAEVVGLSDEEFETVISAATKIFRESDNPAAALVKAVEYWDYIPDNIVRALLVFHIGALTGKDFLENENVGLKLFIDAFKFGYTEGFKEGFKEGFGIVKFFLKDEPDKTD